MSKTPKEKFSFGKFIAVFLLPVLLIIGLCLTVFRNLFEHFSVFGLIMLIIVVVLFILPMGAAISLFISKKSDDK